MFLTLMLIYLQACAASNSTLLFEEVKSLAEQGNLEASYYLGMLYNNGLGTKQDIKKAYKWFKISAKSGDPLGNFKLGCYYGGQFKEIIQIDKDKALEHKLIAARAGYSLAQHSVADFYYNKNDIQSSIEWFELSAAQGYTNSLMSLYAYYSMGIDVPVNHKKAYYYLKIISNHWKNGRSDKIKDKLVKHKGHLTSQEVSDVDLEANDWKPKLSPVTIRASRGIKEIEDLIQKNKIQPGV